MDVEPSFAVIGHLIGVPARAQMLRALMDGRALTATELAYRANVTPQTASSHLAKLAQANLVLAERHGRHRYYRLASPAVSDALEPLTNLVTDKPVPARKPSKELTRLRDARLCYDHLAGALGVALTDDLLHRRALKPEGRDFALTARGESLLGELGIDAGQVRSQRRAFARQCLDWSERRPHLGGALGAALAARLLGLGWIKREKQGRQVWLTDQGRAEIGQRFPTLDATLLAE